MNFIDIAHASEEAHELTETTESTNGGVLSSLGINGQLFVFQLINFALVAAILWFLILKPLTKKMAERKKIIDESLDNVKKIEDNLTKSNSEYQKIISEAKVESNQILEKTAGESKRLSEEIKEQSKKEIESLVIQAKERIKEEREEMISVIKKDAGELVIAALEKILKEKVDGKKDKELIENAVKSIKLKK